MPSAKSMTTTPARANQYPARSTGNLRLPSREVQEMVAAELHIPVSRVYGVVTFYSFFTMTPKGKIPRFPSVWEPPVMCGEPRKVLDEFQRQLEIKIGETTPDGLFSLTACVVSACGLAPVVTIGGKVYGRITPEKVRISYRNTISAKNKSFSFKSLCRFTCMHERFIINRWQGRK